MNTVGVLSPVSFVGAHSCAPALEGGCYPPLHGYGQGPVRRHPIILNYRATEVRGMARLAGWAVTQADLKALSWQKEDV